MSKSRGITIRPLKTKETPQIKRLLNRSFPFLQRLFVTLRGREILAAETEGKLVGAVVLKTFYLPGKGKAGLVEWIFADPAARGMGVGEKLLDAALKFFKKKGVAETFAIIEGSNTSSANLFVSRDFALLPPGEQFKGYKLNTFLIWIYTFHYIDLGHFLYVRPASPGIKERPALQWLANWLLVSLIALLAIWRGSVFFPLDESLYPLVPLSFLLLFGVREVAMGLAARLQGLKVRYRIWESGLLLNSGLALLFGWFFPVTGNIYPKNERWRHQEYIPALGVTALAGSLSLLLMAWSGPAYSFITGTELNEQFSLFFWLASFTAFFDIALPFFPFSGYNGRRLWDWHKIVWVVLAALAVLLMVV